jgi:hypothetical protein
MKQKQKSKGQQSANAEIRKAETPIIDQLVSLKDVLESMSKDIDMALDYYRLKVGGTYKNEDENKNKIRPELQSKKYMYAKTRDNLISSIEYIISDLYDYPKERQYGLYNEILGVDFGVLKDFLEKEEDK